MTRGRRFFQCAAVAILGAGVLVLAVWLTPRERLLLPLATRIGSDEDAGHWLSDDETAQLDFPMDGRHAPELKIIDLRTGTERSRTLDAASRGTHADVAIAPDGEWALCWDTSHKAFGITALNLRTGARLHWPMTGDPYHYPLLWMPDSRHWISTTCIADGEVTLYSVLPAEPPVTSRLPNADAVRWKRYETATNSCLLVLDDESRNSTPIRNGIDLAEYRLEPEARLLRTVRIRLSITGKVLEVTPSPDGTRIAWIFRETRWPVLALWVHRFIRAVPARPQEVASLWITDLYGGHLREVGHVPALPDNDSLADVSWLPDGRSLSFVHADSLFTVPAEGQR